MKKVVLFLSIAAMGCLLVPPAWAESPSSKELEALKQQMSELNKIVQSQQQQIQEQDKKLKQQDEKLQQQEQKIQQLEQPAEAPVVAREEVTYGDLQSIVDKVKAELPKPQDGFTLGGGKIRITPYGFARLDMAYDDSATYFFSGNANAWAWPEDGKPMPFGSPVFGGTVDQNHQGGDNAFSATATATRLGMNLEGPEFAGGTIKGKVEVDFDELYANGGDVVAHRIRMRHAYGELVYPTWSLLAGQTWDVVAPRIPNMIDCVVMWGSGNVGYRRPQLRLTKKWDLNGPLLTGQFSLNHTDRTLTDDINKDMILNGEDSGIPMAEGRVGLDTVIVGQRKLGLGVSAAYGKKQIDKVGNTHADYIDVWMVALDGSVVVIPDLFTVQGEIWTGSDIDNLYGGVIQGFAFIKDASGRIIELEEVDATGGFLAGTLTPRKNLQFNFGYGIDNPDDEDLIFTPLPLAPDGQEQAPGLRSLNWTVFANGIWTVVPNFDIGLELAYHKTRWVDQAHGDDFRIQSAFIYKF